MRASELNGPEASTRPASHGTGDEIVWRRVNRAEKGPGGEFVAIVGKSGCDKSTLLNMLAGIDRPASVGVLVADTPVHALGQDQLAAWRGRVVGVVFRFFQLLPR